MTEVSILSLVKRYGDHAAIDAITLKVKQGEFVSLLGPSGCGKTTTLKCLAGFEEADDGRILFDGVDVSRLPPEQRDIGMVFQNYALFPHMNVAQNLAFGLEMRKVSRPEIKRRVDAALELVQLSGLGKRYPRELSGGQQQRVALARALVIEPKILLLDEPLANLDAKLRDEMRTFIRELQQRVGITTIYVTHDQAEAMTMSDKVVVMFAGRIAQADDPETIYDRPVNRAVAAFVGQANILSCTAPDPAGGATGLRTAGGAIPIPNALSDKNFTTIDIMARPEAIRIVAADDSRAHLTGRVVGRYFHGAFVDYRIALAENILTVQVPPPARFGEGETVGLVLDPARLWPLRDAG
ncbi:ABC transporter ATP-binding protein [Methylocapsa sp. S129]|uniref:ABC transporter ATP-binding protein n=1 Tax=Methylocapsa sp. S129 TaxID=1641869 RepID=UPI00131B57DF|nr:ABC transporter ATP-binding protein [Methylocapsa sp. S129]